MKPIVIKNKFDWNRRKILSLRVQVCDLYSAEIWIDQADDAPKKISVVEMGYLALSSSPECFLEYAEMLQFIAHILDGTLDYSQAALTEVEEGEEHVDTDGSWDRRNSNLL